ncbi:fumarate hydratase [Photobacterium phosphoreum]|jgi:fumarate hydratase class I|uniref:Fumarate hydratase class I n=1 Tax=Photobacterium phosphoreum TaxID=659 RepID=A0A2T3PW40_PHOPO|nr:fumarate hydratase [Photobacterium phosphoreum]MCD9461619.1 fumarate hydratase [Photobacterium phosphoreum]MCD9473589.1 fumarate hydratase [Photobacterium phosphoreum]MCD9500950.1 fumarate hydratase [Photobacterium phosphoreum]MCD9505133.1 fumarate hydratase [Photobacterium phosphoreum]MCD9509478.1 fumarate hydratase [Photobacterium phosphoreum]
MTVICKQDVISSVADALQYISYYHPLDFIQALEKAYNKEQSQAAKDAIAQILINSRMSAEGRRPICQDTGIVTCFVKIGMNVQWDSDLTVQQMVDEGVRQAYTNADNPLRASVVTDPAGARKNTQDNAPAVVHVEMVAGDKVEIQIAAKGGGSENKTKMVMLNPSDDVAEWVEKTVPLMGAGWCPPGMLGIGIGGTAEKAALLAKESLMEAVDIHELQQRGAQTTEEALRLDIYDRVNRLGIGAQGLGGLTTVLDVKVKSAPTHAASKPVCMIPNCAATRHVHFTLDGSGPAELTPPKLSDWPQVTWEVGDNVRRVNLDNITKADVQEWRSGETVLLSGKILTGRDAAHKRIQEMLANGEGLPEGVDFTNRFIYYVGPVDAVRDEVVGPAGPTTSTRMDKFTEMMLGEAGLTGMIGKAERGPATIASIKQHKAVYLMAVGGAAYLVAKAIKKARVVAFADLGMEAIYEFEVEDMPVTVAVDAEGVNAHQTGPDTWRVNIAEMAK